MFSVEESAEIRVPGLEIYREYAFSAPKAVLEKAADLCRQGGPVNKLAAHGLIARSWFIGDPGRWREDLVANRGGQPSDVFKAACEEVLAGESVVEWVSDFLQEVEQYQLRVESEALGSLVRRRDLLDAAEGSLFAAGVLFGSLRRRDDKLAARHPQVLLYVATLRTKWFRESNDLAAAPEDLWWRAL